MKRALIFVSLLVLILSCREKTGTGPGPGGGGTPPKRNAEFDDPQKVPFESSVLSTVPGGRRDFRRDPPQVRSTELEVTGGGANPQVKALVRFAEGNVPSDLSIETEDGKVALRDDGQGGDATAKDGVFTAVTTVPSAFLEDRQRAFREVAKAGTIRRFRGRELVTEKIDPELLRSNRVVILPPFFPFPPPPPAPPFTNDRSLMITAPGVVNDPTRTNNPCMPGAPGLGHWSLGYMLTQMANTPLTGISPSNFTKLWLQQWQADQNINTFVVPKRINIKTDVIDPWLAASGGVNFDMTKAPFRLVAIVNRIDLHDNVGYGPGGAGELRFVYGLVKGCAPAPFSVIVEIGVPPKSCLGLKNYGMQWVNLSGMVPGTPAYNAALQAITDPITAANAMPAKPNGSALNQVRTNEIDLAAPWELREFRIDGSSHRLNETTVKQTPDIGFNNTPTKFTDFVNGNLAAIHAGTYVVPLDFPVVGEPFLAGAAPTPGGMHWRGNPAIADNEARRIVSVGTCNGCHAGETQTPFTHVSVTHPLAASATLSGFLTGIDVIDPVLGPPTTHHYEDLTDRHAKLQGLLGTPCFFHGLFFEPLRFVH